MTLGQPGFDPGLALVQPIQRWVHLLVGYILESEFRMRLTIRAKTMLRTRGRMRVSSWS